MNDFETNTRVDDSGNCRTHSLYKSREGQVTAVQSSLLLPELDPLEVKERRSYAHATQRLKKRRDRSKPPKSCGCCTPWRFRHARQPKQARHNEAVIANRQGAMFSVDDVNGFNEEQQSGSGLPSIGFPAVSLVDFVTAPSKKSVKQFELIYRPRQVLTFDDMSETESELDPDWEDIATEFWPSGRNPNSQSYAQVVATIIQIKDSDTNV